MKLDDAKALWNEICYLLSVSIKSGISERDFELQVVRAVEKLGWSEYLGEIEKQPIIQFGRKALRPDIVVYDSKKRALVPIEVKRPAENLSNDHIDGQLKSYMLQLKAKFGLVIGDSIKLFYDGPEKNSITNHPLMLKEISFDASFLADGVDFVLNINKSSLLNGSNGSYIRNLIERVRAKRDINELKKLLGSSETEEKIRDFLRREYSEYGPEIVDKAVESLTIQLSIGDHQIPDILPTQSVPPSTRNESIRETVYNVIRENKNGISKKEIETVLKLNKRQITNAVYKLSRQNKIYALEKGVYVDSKADISNKKSPPTSKPLNADLLPGNLLLVYKAVCRKKRGTTLEEIEYRSGLFGRQVSNALYKLKKRGLVDNLEKGNWIAAIHLNQSVKSLKNKNQPTSQATLNSGSILDSIFNLIRRYKGGIDVQSIRERLQLEDRQVSNALYKLSKRGMVESVGRGKYIAL